MLRSSSAIRNHDGSLRHSGHSPDGSVSASWVTGRCMVAISAACRAGTSAQNWPWNRSWVMYRSVVPSLRAFASLQQLCSPALDRLERLPGPQQDALGVALGLRAGQTPDRFLVALAALSLLSEAAEERPLLCAVDDAQWLDEASAVALSFVARRLLAEPVAIIFVTREPIPTLSGLPELVLDGVGDDDAHLLLASAMAGPLDERARETIIAETRGEPPRASGTSPRPDPAGACRRVRARQGTAAGRPYPAELPPTGPVAPPSLATTAAHGSGGAARRRHPALAGGRATSNRRRRARAAEAAGLIERGARVRFRHPLVRSATYRAAAPSDRRQAHRALADAISRATGSAPLPYTSLALLAWRGHEAPALRAIESSLRDATARGEGRAIGLAHYATAVLYNGLGRYQDGLTAAQRACAHEDLGFFGWALIELVEAGARSDARVVAAAALRQLDQRTRASGTDWALGVRARSMALLSDGTAAEALYREAIERLGRSSVAVHLGRAQLVYGEWLRRENRRVDAREQLRAAHDTFSRIGADGFAERTRRELSATGETAHKRTLDTHDVLTAQEAQIAHLARDGLSNPEIGARLFISPRTVQYHLGKVFAKLDVTSRNQLGRVPPSRLSPA